METAAVFAARPSVWPNVAGAVVAVNSGAAAATELTGSSRLASGASEVEWARRATWIAVLKEVEEVQVAALGV